MNKQQKEVIQAQLNNEKACLESIKEAYEGALADVNDKIANLLGRNDSDLQNVIYQVQYQNTIKAQIEPILAQLQANSFETMSDYLNKCYEEGFLGTMYNLQSQGIPLIFPIDQAQVVDAITKETKLSTNLYSRLGKDVNKLKKDISAEISRGISQNMTYNSIASNISLYAGISRNNAVRIAKTEGHRISSKASMDACVEAKENGADVVKQWDATLDSKTRDSHRQCDGEVVEIDEEFSNGLMYPSDPMGDAEETINCRCVLLERARWAVENDSFTKFEGFSGKMMEFDSAQDYAEFKDRYWSDANIKEMQFVKDMQEKYDTKEFGSLLMSMSDQEYEKYSELHENNPFYKEVKVEQPKESPQESKVENTTDFYGYTTENNTDIVEKQINGDIIEFRKQLDTGFKGKIPDDQLETYNSKGLQQIKIDTGFSNEKSEELHNAMLEYFGGDYEAILSGENEKAKIIKEGIEKMPKYEGFISRGIVLDDNDFRQFSSLKTGDTLPSKGIVSSWSSDKNVARSFSGINDYYRNSIIIECENNISGAGVQHLSKFGTKEAEVLSDAKYEIVDVIKENKFDYLSNHKELLYMPDDLDWVEDDVRRKIVCRIIVKEKT